MDNKMKKYVYYANGCNHITYRASQLFEDWGYKIVVIDEAKNRGGLCDVNSVDLRPSPYPTFINFDRYVGICNNTKNLPKNILYTKLGVPLDCYSKFECNKLLRTVNNLPYLIIPNTVRVSPNWFVKYDRSQGSKLVGFAYKLLNCEKNKDIIFQEPAPVELNNTSELCIAVIDGKIYWDWFVCFGNTSRVLNSGFDYSIVWVKESNNQKDLPYGDLKLPQDDPIIKSFKRINLELDNKTYTMIDNIAKLMVNTFKVNNGFISAEMALNEKMKQFFLFEVDFRICEHSFIHSNCQMNLLRKWLDDYYKDCKD